MCHKGVPLADAGDAEHTHVHPTTPDRQGPDIGRMRYCRGWMSYASRNNAVHKLLPRDDE